MECSTRNRNETFKAQGEKDLVTQIEIMSHLDDQQADIIQKFETSHEMWMDLQNEIEQTINGNHVMT